MYLLYRQIFHYSWDDGTLFLHILFYLSLGRQIPIGGEDGGMAKLGETPYNHHKHMPSKVVGKPITVAKNSSSGRHYN